MQKIRESQAKMAELEAIQTVVTQAAIQATMAAVIVMKGADDGPISGANKVITEEVCRQRYGRPTSM